MIRPGLGSELPAAHADVSWILGHLALPGHVDGARPALRWIDGERSYADLRRRARGLATAFVAAGLRPGDRVASHLVNRGEIFELYFACAYAGLTLVPVSFRLAHETPGPGDGSVRLGNGRGILPYSVLVDDQGRVAKTHYGAFADVAAVRAWVRD